MIKGCSNFGGSENKLLLKLQVRASQFFTVLLSAVFVNFTAI